MSISNPVPAGVWLFCFPHASILIVSFSLAWLWMSLAVCSHCSTQDGLFARSEVISVFERPMFSVGRAVSHVGSISFPLPFSLLLWFIFWGCSWL